MRLIDADALKKEIHRYALDVYCINLENSKEFAGDSTAENYCEGLYEAIELIDNAPTVDVMRCKYSVCGSIEAPLWQDTGTVLAAAQR